MDNPTVYINARFLTQHVTGVQRYGLALVAAIDGLVAAGHPATAGLRFVLLAPPGPLAHRLELRCLELRQVGTGRGYLWEQAVLPAHCRDGLLFCPGNTAPVRALRGGRVVVTVHSLAYRTAPASYSRAFRLAYRLLMPRIMRHARRVITVSEAERRNILEVFPEAAARLVAVANGGLPDPWLERALAAPAAPDTAAPYVLYVGSLSRLKNTHGLLAAAPALTARGLGLRIVGGTAAALAAQHDLTVPAGARVEFAGQVDDPGELVAHLRGATCFLFPSFSESSGIPPLEAMACGCPVVCSRLAALEERCGDAALYCDPHDPADIAAKAIRAATDPVTRAALVARGRALAAEATWPRCAERTLAVLREALA
jgi:glycosyltransferase involved in cell wall biosynthesis